jgi:formylglycine-generating enzyme required for sulfatase activity
MDSLRGYRGLTLLIVIFLAGNLLGCSGSDGSKVTPQEAVGSSARSAQSVSPSQARLLGDLDGDGQPSVGDAIKILRIIVGLDLDTECADANENGSTDVGDAIIVLRCIVGLDDWPLGECGGGGGDPGEETTGPDSQTLVWAPAGSFMMGSEDGRDDELPVHQVTLDGFWIGKCEVTNDQYAAFLNQAQPADVHEWLGIDDDTCGIEHVGGVYQAKSQLGQYPAVDVSWYGALAYCDHYGYTLPTEAQWEYAAAGLGARTYPWGADWDQEKCCNFYNTGPFGNTFPVGSFPAGASWCGALDMAGNVFEWCADWYDADYYQVSPELNPPGPADGTYKVLRGGSWRYRGNFCRTTNRVGNNPTFTYDDNGFRVSRTGR